MSFVPVTGPASFRAGEPPRDGVVEFSDERRTVALPIRGALPVLTKAHSARRPAPERGAAERRGPARACGSSRPASSDPTRAGCRGRWPRWRRPTRTGSPSSPPRARTPASTRRPPRGSCAPCSTPSPTRCRGPPRSRPVGRRSPAGRPAPRAHTRRSRLHPSPPGAGGPRPGPVRATTGPSSSRSRCGSRPTRRSWSPAPYASCSRCTPPRTPPTSAMPPCSGPSPAPTPATASATARAPTPASRCVRRPTRGRCSSASSSCASPTS